MSMQEVDPIEAPKFWLGWLDWSNSNCTEALQPNEPIERLRAHMNTQNPLNDYYRVNGKIATKEEFLAAWTWFTANVPEIDRRGHTAKYSESPDPQHFLWLVNVYKRGHKNGENEII